MKKRHLPAKKCDQQQKDKGENLASQNLSNSYGNILKRQKSEKTAVIINHSFLGTFIRLLYFDKNLAALMETEWQNPMMTILQFLPI